MEKEQLQELLNQRVEQCVNPMRNSHTLCPKTEAKKESLTKRNAEIVKVHATGKINRKTIQDHQEKIFYSVHFKYFIKQNGHFYIEEEVEERIADFDKGRLVTDREEVRPTKAERHSVLLIDSEERSKKGAFRYNRLKAVKYAETWWNDYNPAYIKFDSDCTNFISQCLHAGNAPMLGYPKRGSGWWMMNRSWSYSWTVANTLRWYLPNSKTGLRGREVDDPEELQLGDVICYDFQGDGRFDHITIVTGKDANGMPLVNAHTFNSRMRYWAYEDSSAYTPNIKYRFFHIIDDFS